MERRARRSREGAAAGAAGRLPPAAALGGALVLWLGLAAPAGATAWEAAAGDLGRNAHRFAVHFGASYGVLTGNEVPKTEAGPGFEAGVSWRVLSSLSLYAGGAWHTSNVKGQIASLLDVNVRPDGRSGTVEGKIVTPRLRGGLRVDAYRMQDWKFQVYFVGGAMFSFVEATLDSIDGAPPSPYESPAGFLVDPGTITADLFGLFGRVGVDYLVGSRLAVDANFTFETIDPPPGTNDLSTFTLGAVFRF